MCIRDRRGAIKPLFEYDSKTGQITSNEIPVPIAESVSYKYKRDGKPDKLLLEKGRRVKEEIFDFVSTADSSTLQVGHVLTGIETQLFNKNPDNSVPLATWAGDLGQLCWESVTLAKGEKPSKDEWNKTWKTKARLSEMAGDIVGAAHSESAAKAIAGGKPLSHVLEGLFPPGWRPVTLKAFETKYKLGSISSPDKDAVKRIVDLANAGALAFSKLIWIAVKQEVKDDVLPRSAAHLVLSLVTMRDQPVPPPDSI